MAFEYGIENEVVEWAEEDGWLVRKLKWIGRRSAPDRLFAKGGRVVFIEFKDPDGRMSEGQKRERKRMLDAGMDVHTIDSVEEAIRVLSK